MSNPFRVLEVDETAGDAEIQKAYLRQVRTFPPDRAPERFQAIREAFETIRTRRDRLRYQLFRAELPEPTELLDTRDRIQNQRPDLELTQRALARSLGLPVGG